MRRHPPRRPPSTRQELRHRHRTRPARARKPRSAETAYGLDVDLFFDGALTEEPQTAACMLSDGTETSCYQPMVARFPSNRDSIGPWCPETTSDGAARIWFDGDAVYDIDGQFISDLADIYDDTTWKLYDEDGNVLSTDTSEKFNDLATGGAQAWRASAVLRPPPTLRPVAQAAVVTATRRTTARR